VQEQFYADINALADKQAEDDAKRREKEATAQQKALDHDLDEAHRAADVKKQIQKEILDQSLALLDQTLGAQFAAAEARVQSDIDMLEAKDELTKREEQILDRLQGKKKRIAIANFVAEKAAAVSSIVIGTARNAVAWGAPPPVGLGPAGPPAALFLGGIQLAAAAATPPPKFHTGGVIEPGEQQATVLGGEAVLNQQATRQLGRSGVDALNRGAGMDSGTLNKILGVLERLEAQQRRARNTDGRRFAPAGSAGITRGYDGL